MNNAERILTPLELVLKRLHLTPAKLAEYLKISQVTICRWRHNEGNIPRNYHDKILELANTNKLTGNELKIGGTSNDYKRENLC